jgi:Ni,Fe-hydrogenase III large subunit
MIPVEQLAQQDVIEIKGMSKQQLFQKSNAWLATSFRSYKAVSQFADPEAGKLVANVAVSWVEILTSMSMMVQLQIDVKDGRVRFTSTPTEMYQEGKAVGFYEAGRDDYMKRAAVFKESYLSYMRGSAKSENW